MKKDVTAMDLETYVAEMRKIGFYRESKSDYIIMCPHCYAAKKAKGVNNYKKLKLYIDKSGLFGRCFVCNSVFVSQNDSLRTSIRWEEPPIDVNNWEVCKLGNDGYFTLNRFYEFDEFDEAGVHYLTIDRLYLYETMYKELGIRFHNSNPVVPFFYKGELIYYQLKIIDPKSNIKYFSPKVAHKNPYIIETGENKRFVICEGTFDAIACKILYSDRTPFAVLGSDITPYQIAMLRSYCPEDILIYMDKTELSLKVKSIISNVINYAEINIVESDGTDPEEQLKLNILNNAINIL